MDCSPPGSSVHGTLQARVLEWAAISFSRGSSRPRDQTQVSRIAGRRFNLWATREAHSIYNTKLPIHLPSIPSPPWQPRACSLGSQHPHLVAKPPHSNLPEGKLLGERRRKTECTGNFCIFLSIFLWILNYSKMWSLTKKSFSYCFWPKKAYFVGGGGGKKKQASIDCLCILSGTFLILFKAVWMALEEQKYKTETQIHISITSEVGKLTILGGHIPLCEQGNR